jgi:bifunctional DNA-binding transcriptional regulator/antitoxin component of YhaV-PrlF toxin-antitoxin module
VIRVIPEALGFDKASLFFRRLTHLLLPQKQLALANRIAAMQHCSMTTLPLSKRGSLTLPPALRRKMGLDKLRNPMLLVEERDGGLFLQPAMALPVRDIPRAQIEAWIARDEADMKAFRAAGKKKK